jgi:hypothetical protein
MPSSDVRLSFVIERSFGRTAVVDKHRSFGVLTGLTMPG